MCSPNALFGLNTGATAYQTVGSYYAASAQKSALKGEAQIADINAQLSDLSAKNAILAGQKTEQASRLKYADAKSTQIASIAANGFDLSEGSARNIVLSTDVLNEIDANQIAANALSQAWGFKTQATNFRNDAILKRGQAKGINPFMQAAGTLLTGASQTASNKYAMDKYATGSPTGKVG